MLVLFALRPFALRTQNQAFTPFQEYLRKAMEGLGRDDLRHLVSHRGLGSRHLNYIFSGENYLVRVDEEKEEDKGDEDNDGEDEDENEDEEHDEDDYQPVLDGFIAIPTHDGTMRERQLNFYRYYQQHPEEDVWNLRSLAPPIQQTLEGSVSDLGQYQLDQQASGGGISNPELHNEVEDNQPDQHHSEGS
ncbi:hypothetical protein MMC22_002583 [Lobaria immixta]|nr:hypothetical protein [Lobaria immixta]